MNETFTSIFNLDYTEQESLVVLNSAPWEATVSYSHGTSLAPQQILKASEQIDLYDLKLKDVYKQGIHFKKINEDILDLSKTTQKLVNEYRKSENPQLLQKINNHSEEVNKWTYQETTKVLSQQKIPGLIGGDHSTPFGAIKAISENNTSFSILHIDAHMDLRESYEGFHHSHASIMRNIMNLPNPPKKLVQVAIRDFCEEEFLFYKENDSRIEIYFDRNIHHDLSSGKKWLDLCKEIVSSLSDSVYISYDIDGLSPEFCPNTGTPVPGGLSFNQAVDLIQEVVNQRKMILGFDLVETSNGSEGNEYNANVAMRLLYQLCINSIKTHSTEQN